jgi:hypothetical protein
MSTDEGLLEAPYPYHISLNFQDAPDEDLKEVFDKWDGRAHVLKIDHVSQGAFAGFRNWLLLFFLFLRSAIADAADACI